MAIITASYKSAEKLLCPLCSVSLSLDKATAGFYDADGRQTFACVSHFAETEKIIMGWADFIIRERAKCLSRGMEQSDPLYGRANADVRFSS